jgi:hypothetical protein
MKKESFLKLLDLISTINKDAERLGKLGIDIYECTLMVGTSEMFDTIMEHVYGSEGLDWILWWVYEKSANNNLKAYETDANGNSIEIVKTVDELYEYLEKYHRVS